MFLPSYLSKTFKVAFTPRFCATILDSPPSQEKAGSSQTLVIAKSKFSTGTSDSSRSLKPFSIITSLPVKSVTPSTV
jgi:hypothetical protein